MIFHRKLKNKLMVRRRLNQDHLTASILLVTLVIFFSHFIPHNSKTRRQMPRQPINWMSLRAKEILNSRQFSYNRIFYFSQFTGGVIAHKKSPHRARNWEPSQLSTLTLRTMMENWIMNGRKISFCVNISLSVCRWMENCEHFLFYTSFHDWFDECAVVIRSIIYPLKIFSCVKSWHRILVTVIYVLYLSILHYL